MKTSELDIELRVRKEQNKPIESIRKEIAKIRVETLKNKHNKKTKI